MTDQIKAAALTVRDGLPNVLGSTATAQLPGEDVGGVVEGVAEGAGVSHTASASTIPVGG